MGQDLEEDWHRLKMHLPSVTSPGEGGYSARATAREPLLPVRRVMGNLGIFVS